jgi:peptidoglycan-associated lipoprotein
MLTALAGSLYLFGLLFICVGKTMRRIGPVLLTCLFVWGCSTQKNTGETMASVAEPPPAAAPASPPATAEDFLANVANNRVLFDYDSWTLSSAAQDTLRRQATWLSANPAVSVVVEGHCDERGTREYNLGLGDRRANAIQAFLVAAGVDRGRIRTISYGKDRPAVVGSDENAWAQNRRGVTARAQ